MGRDGRHGSVLRLAGSLGAAALLVLASSGRATADTQLSTRGLTGPHALRDGSGAPGATCTYAGGHLDTIKVRPPRVRARDVSGTRDHQSVRWAIRIDYWDVNLFWSTAEAFPPSTATAWDDQPAAFSAKTIDAPTGFGGEYRVVVVMTWLRGGLVEGRSSHRV